MNLSKTVVGVDTAKRVFQLHWIEQETGEIVSVQLKREKFLEHFANRAPCLIGMEACGGVTTTGQGNYMAMGHQVKLDAGQGGASLRSAATRATCMTPAPFGQQYSNQASKRSRSRAKNNKPSLRCTACASSW